MKVLLFCCKAFETMEFSPFIDVCGWARESFGVDIEVVTAGFAKTVISTFGIPVIMDKTIDEINAADYDALAIPGGFQEFGFYEEACSEPFLDLIRQFDAAGKTIATVCVAALALSKSGILRGRKATTYHLGDRSRQKWLAEFGADVIPDQSIVVDGNVITSFCPETAPSVAFRLLAFLAGDEKARIVSEAMGYQFG